MDLERIIGFTLIGAAVGMLASLSMMRRPVERALQGTDPAPYRVATRLAPAVALRAVSHAMTAARHKVVHAEGWAFVVRPRRFPWSDNTHGVLLVFGDAGGGAVVEVNVVPTGGRILPRHRDKRRRQLVKLVEASLHTAEQGGPVPEGPAPVRRVTGALQGVTTIVMALVLGITGATLVIRAEQPGTAESLGLRVLKEAGLTEDELLERFGPMDEEAAFNKGQELLQDGLLRLDVAGLARVHTFGRLVVDRAGAQLCAAFAMGDPSVKDLLGEFNDVLEDLDERTQDRVVEIMGTAVRAALEGRPLQPPLSPAEAERAFARLQELIGPAELGLVSSYGKPGTTDEEVCAASRRLYRGLDEIRGADRGLVLRAVYQAGQANGT